MIIQPGLKQARLFNRMAISTFNPSFTIAKPAGTGDAQQGELP
jgi:hypothetical protein